MVLPSIASYRRLPMAVKIPPRVIFPVLPATSRVPSRAAASAAAEDRRSRPMSYRTLKERATFEREIKKSKFIAIASHVPNERSAHSFLSQVSEPKASHNCWAYKLGDQFRSNDDGEPSGTAGKPILSAILSSGIDMVVVVVIRYFGGIKLGAGGLVRAYGGVASECLKGSVTCQVKSKVPMGVEVPFDLIGALYHQIQNFHVEDIKQDYDTGKDGFVVVTFKVDFDKVENLEDAIKTNCSRSLEFFRH